MAQIFKILKNKTIFPDIFFTKNFRTIPPPQMGNERDFGTSLYYLPINDDFCKHILLKHNPEDWTSRCGGVARYLKTG